MQKISHLDLPILEEKNDVPFNHPQSFGTELTYIRDSISAGQISYNGKYTQKCENFLENKLKAKKVLLTTSCTSALEMSAILLNISQNDEIIMPSFTFVSTANAFAIRGAKPVFVDINYSTLNIDENKIEKSITQKTKAIVVVHYSGRPCNMNAVIKIAKKHNLYIIEDNAHGLGGKYNNKHLGTIGDIGTLSFHETKNFHCGEGGAIIINNESLLNKADIVHAKGTNRKSFYKGEAKKYTWVDYGSSYGMSDLNAAFLYSHFENYEAILEKRRIQSEYYYHHLKDLPGLLDTYKPSKNFANHIFYILVKSNIRDSLILFLKRNSILAPFHYIPLHNSPMANKQGYNLQDLTITEMVSKEIIRLPLFYSLTVQKQNKVIDTIKKYLINNE